jgi:hypothetical protein
MGLRHARPVVIDLSFIIRDLQLVVSSYLYETEESLRRWCKSSMCVTSCPGTPETIFRNEELCFIFVPENVLWNIGYVSGKDTVYCCHAWQRDGLPRIASFQTLEKAFRFVLSHRGDIQLAPEECGCNRNIMKKAARNLEMHLINGKLVI